MRDGEWKIRASLIFREKEDTVSTYTAVSDLGAMPAMLITEDFIHFERKDSIFPPENKDVVTFPEKVDGKYYACHRPVPFEIGTPDIWIASSPDLMNWGSRKPILEPETVYEKKGFFGGVVFSCGCILQKNMVYLYYGAADDKIAGAVISLQDLFDSMQQEGQENDTVYSGADAGRAPAHKRTERVS